MIEIDILTEHLSIFRKEFDKISSFYLQSYTEIDKNFTRVTFASYKDTETEQAIYDLGFQVAQLTSK